MPTAIKRRKVTATTRSASSSSSQFGGIGPFGRVSKATSTVQAGTAKKNYDTVAITPYSTENKRKVVDIEEESTPDVSAIISAAISDRHIKPLPRRSNDLQTFPNTPNKPISKAGSTSETPTNGAPGLLDKLFVSTPQKQPESETLTPSAKTATNSSSLLKPEIPIELLDLINLHAAFLTALSLHYAHNGTHSPADTRVLCPQVARAWGKRGVTLLDIRRTLGVTNTEISEEDRDSKISRLSLSNYGHGKICVEIRTAAGKAGRMPRPLDENLLNDTFVRGLKAAWYGRTNPDMKAPEFISTLPLEAISTCSSVIKMSPLLAKGQRRLEDLKAGITVKKASSKEEKPTPDGTKPTLLERLRAKQLHQSTLPAPPTKEDLSRRAALQRIEEVAALLSILSTSASISQQRVSFTLPTLFGKLRDSYRNPISKDEANACVKLLASEIAPDWVRLVKMGSLDALVVTPESRPSESDIKERVRRAS
jgi:hypothetical protein